MGIRNKQNSLAFKVGLGFGLIGLVLITALLITIVNLSRIDNLTNDLLGQQKPYAEYSLDLINGLDKAIIAERNWLVTQESSYQDTKEAVFKQDVYPALTMLQSLTQSWNNAQSFSQLQSIESNISRLRDALNKAEEIATTNGESSALNYIMTDVLPISHEIRKALNSIISTQSAMAKGSLQEVQLKRLK